jgi:hypothetical protein
MISENKDSQVEFRLGQYRHFKGNLYDVIGKVRHSETQEQMVLYRALYGEGGLWVRPYQMFFGTIEREGQEFKRFEYVNEQENQSRPDNDRN